MFNRILIQLERNNATKAVNPFFEILRQMLQNNQRLIISNVRLIIRCKSYSLLCWACDKCMGFNIWRFCLRCILIKTLLWQEQLDIAESYLKKQKCILNVYTEMDLYEQQKLLGKECFQENKIYKKKNIFSSFDCALGPSGKILCRFILMKTLNIMLIYCLINI